MRTSRDVLTQRLLAAGLLLLVVWLLLIPLVNLVVHSPTTALTQFMNGLSYSLLIFLIATGFSLIFGMMNFVNLAHGSFYMLGAYIAYSVVGRNTNNFWWALLAAPLAVAVIAVVLEWGYLRPLYKRGHLDQVLLTFGFAFVFADMVRAIWGADIRSLPRPPQLDGTVTLFGWSYPQYRFSTIVFGLAVALLLWLLLERTRLGSIVRAGVADPEMVSGLGINITVVFAAVFAIGAALAALSGVVAGPILGMAPGMDFDVLIVALIVVVVGGLGTFSGSFWGSLLIGIADTFGKVLQPDFSMALTFAVMAAVLLLRPAGLFGRLEA
ncbi:MAG TPA: branched-chain amino acid ABC transporter permease [Chloroflexota bacterium]|nr:branched-chain amino acid ABC transporter permease [Chloroflexota bacterium]